jgi:ABC-2 type transport system permease protein
MLWTIARKELLDTLRDGRFRVAAAVVLILTLAALAAGWKHYRDVSTQHDDARRATRSQWLNQPKKNPHSAAHYGIYAFKPITQLGMVDSGIDPYVGVAAWLEAHRQNEFRYRPAQDRTGVQRFGELTAAAVLQVLLPLLIILMAFPAFAGEREAGTLRLVLSLGVERGRLLTGKAFGIAGALSLVLVPSVVLGVATLALTADSGALATTTSRAALVVLAYILYLAIFVGLALAASAWLPTSRLALVTLLAFWMFNGLVVPRVAANIAARRHPLPSTIEFRRAMERDLNDTRELDARLAAKRAALIKQYGVDNIDALPVAFSGVSLQEGEEHGNEVFDQHYGALFDIYERQNSTSVLAGSIAPFSAIRSLSMALAGTDFAHHRHFVTAAEDYRRTIQRVMNADIAANQKPGETYLAGADLWERVPDFEYFAPSTSWVLSRQVPALVALLAWSVLAWLLATAAVRRAAVL